MEQTFNEKRYTDEAMIFKAFCDENRLLIIDMLRSGEKCACKILENLQISQSTLSHHMKILCESGMVESRTEGKWTHYSINVDGIRQAKAILEKIALEDSPENPDFK
jgi:ArsR family transcriptional regulator